MPRVFAIVPAAGRSRRMGQPKQLMPIDGRPMLARVLDALRSLDVVVVGNSEIDLDLSRGSFVLNDDPNSEMIDSIRLALRELDSQHPAQAEDGILICPSDQPNLSGDDVERCVAAFAQSPSKIVIASSNGKRGHPMIFPRDLSIDVHSRLCDEGLNALPRTYPERVREVECETSVVQNINTPEDYRQL